MKAVFPAIAALLFISGCGPGLVYRQMDWIVPWYVSDYLDLSAEQRGELDRRLALQLEWHCQTQLPRYSALLRRAKKALSQPDPPLSRDVIDSYYDTVLAYREDLIRQLGPEAAALLATADDRQIDDLFERLERQNRRFGEKYLTGPVNARIDSRSARMVDRFEKWIGPLTMSQREAVARWSKAVDDTGPVWMDYRHRVQSAFRVLLTRHRADPDFQQVFTTMLLTRHAHFPPGTEKMTAGHRQDTVSLLAAVAGSLTPPQREQVVKRLDEMAATVEAISCPVAAVHGNRR